MTQVLTVSATTAGYATDLLKPQQKAVRDSIVEQETRIIAEKVAKSDDYSLRALLNVIQPPALALYFLTASQQNNQQATLQQTLEAYRNSAA
ncbi:hypothetical protein HFC70_16110 [Agrobacterium sp. a22-2]|uniref:hypothetical protein n=1 Tax=Agrobacterium sp. a22-2 TaxID=2283840 RepID=UPI00144875EB|nr:hypothetical protein [Agrobacterium sp. a22-2]NKN37877.1 hypothetical protein [Agrobacterium sp. a22-2]